MKKSLLLLVFLAMFLQPSGSGLAPLAWAATPENNAARCIDGVDNDADGLLDCLDDSCDTKDICQFGKELNCTDGLDNDGDSNVDGADVDCAAACTITQVPESSCSDGFDNDCDGDPDSADADCSSCTPTSNQEHKGGVGACVDAVDNDCDGHTDAADVDCVSTCTVTQTPETSCTDGVDNDCDGTADGNDTDCGAAPSADDNFGQCSYPLPACTADTNDCCQRSFGAGSIIIPMDRCHQSTSGSPNHYYSTGPSSSPTWCQDGNSSGDEGMWHAYGLVYRLMQEGISVHWLVNPTKDPAPATITNNVSSQTWTDRDVDAWIVGDGTCAVPNVGSGLPAIGSLGCNAAPVARLDSTTLAPISGSYSAGAMPLRGGPFVIDAVDRTKFDAFWRKEAVAGAYGLYSGAPYTDSKYDFSAVDLFEVQAGAVLQYQNFIPASGPYVLSAESAPVGTRIDYAAPRMARAGPPAVVSWKWLAQAKLYDPADPGCENGATFNPPEAVVCALSDADVAAGKLVAGDFNMVWYDKYEASGTSDCSNATASAVVSALDDFMTAGATREAGHGMYMASAMALIENCGTSFRVSRSGIQEFQTQPSESLIQRYPANLFSQTGDWPLNFQDAASPPAMEGWYYFGGSATGYRAFSTLKRLLTKETGPVDCTAHKSTATCDTYSNDANGDRIDLALYFRHEDDPDNGLSFYMAGENIGPSPFAAHLRMALNGLIALPGGTRMDEQGIEVSRSAPTLAVIDGSLSTIQGTYLAYPDPQPTRTTYASGDGTDFMFPHVRGHLRALDPDTSGVAGVFWDANEKLMARADDRDIFTCLTYPCGPADHIDIASSDASELYTQLGVTETDAQVLIAKLRRGHLDTNGLPIAKLGGVDRSSAAVIEPSPLFATRPTIVYAGAADGMMHAFCADAVSGTACDEAGKELWAFAPQSQLASLRTNTARIDGSPKVSDAFGDFVNDAGQYIPDGQNEYRTILVFQTGSGIPGDTSFYPAAYALDVTDPTAPAVIWQRKLDGVGVGVALGAIGRDSTLQHVTFLTTNNGANAALQVVAVETDTASGETASCGTGGDCVWSFSRDYSTTWPDPVPITASPGGVAAISLDQARSITDIIATSIEGEIIRIDATTGLVATGSPDPLLRFSGQYHPIGASPAIWADASGALHALAVSGGYLDVLGLNTSWAPLTTEQFVVSVPIDDLAATVTVDDNGTTTGGTPDWPPLSLGTGNRAFAQPVISGGEVYIVTDSDINPNGSTYGTAGSTGTLHRLSVDTGVAKGSTNLITGGVGGVDALAGLVIGNSRGGVERNDFTGDFDAEGYAVQQALDTSLRLLWLVTN